MDEEKDLYIKNKFQEDKLISKKADNIFNKINKGEFFMENNEELKNENSTKENVVSFKKKSPKWKKILATAASLVIVVGAANVYATSQGYDNVFFLIKYLVTGEGKVEGKDNILSDRDITISYEPINIAKDLSIIIKKLQVKDNKAILYVISNDKEDADGNLTPLKFIAYNDKNEKLCEQTSIEDLKVNRTVTDELMLNNFKESDNIINLEIYGANSEKLTTLKINIDEKTVEILGEKEALQKISEIELKDFLGYVAGLSKETDITNNELKIVLAGSMLTTKDDYTDETINDFIAYRVEEIDNMLESFLGEKIENFKDGKLLNLVTKNGNKYYKYIDGIDDTYYAECINISNISYCNGVYTVNYSYYYRNDVPDEDIQMDYYDVYEQEVCISLNDNDKYSKFRVVSYEKPTMINKAINNEENRENVTTKNDTSNNEKTTNNNSINVANNNSNKNNTSNEKIDNYASTMSWTQFWAPGIKFQYPTIFKLDRESEIYNGDNLGIVSTRISGVAVGVDPDTKERIDDDLEIRVYEPQYTKEDINKYIYDNNGNKRASLTTGDGLTWYESTEGEFDKDYTEIYTHIEDSNDGTKWIYKIEFETKGKYNYKVRNITNWLMGSTKLTSF